MLLPQLACQKKFEVISLARNDKVSVIQMRSSLVAYIYRQLERNRIPCAHWHDVEYSSRRAVWPAGPAEPEKPLPMFQNYETFNTILYNTNVSIVQDWSLIVHCVQSCTILKKMVYNSKNTLNTILCRIFIKILS